VKNRKTQSALLMAGAAAGAVAATLFTKRRLRAVPPPTPEPRGLVEPESAELPLGASADPDIDHTLSRSHLPQDATSGGALLGDLETRSEREPTDALDEVWNSAPDAEQTEGYDAVEPENLGAVWLERATQTTHDERAHVSDPNEIPNLEALTMSEGSVMSARAPDEIMEEDEIGEDALGEDALGEDVPDSLNRSGS
jgi:hypothetical protein